MKPGITRHLVLLASAGVVLIMPSSLGSAQSGSGISRLIAVTQLKAENANEEALKGAEEQRGLVKQQKTARDKARETAVLRRLERNASQTNEVLESIRAINKYFQANGCK